MTAPFAMVGDPDAGLCVDGVCGRPAPSEGTSGTQDVRPDAASAHPAGSATDLPPTNRPA